MLAPRRRSCHAAAHRALAPHDAPRKAFQRDSASAGVRKMSRKASTIGEAFQSLTTQVRDWHWLPLPGLAPRANHWQVGLSGAWFSLLPAMPECLLVG
jgi:hypothetical protein